MHISFQQVPAILLALQFITCCDITSAQELLPDKREDRDNALRRVKKLHDTRQGLTSLKQVLNDIDTDLKRDQKLVCLWSGLNPQLCATSLDTNTLPEADTQWINSDTYRDIPSKRSTSLYRDYLYPVNKRTASSERNRLIRNVRVTWSPTCYIGGGNPGVLCHTRNPSEMHRKLTFLEDSPTSPGKRSINSNALSFKSVFLRSNEDVDNIVRKRRGLLILKRILDEMDGDIIVEQKRMCRFNLGGHCATESAAAVADQWHYLNSPLSPGRKRRDTSLFQKLINGEIVKE